MNRSKQCIGATYPGRTVPTPLPELRFIHVQQEQQEQQAQAQQTPTRTHARCVLGQPSEHLRISQATQLLPVHLNGQVPEHVHRFPIRLVHEDPHEASHRLHPHNSHTPPGACFGSFLCLRRFFFLCVGSRCLRHGWRKSKFNATQARERGSE